MKHRAVATFLLGVVSLLAMWVTRVVDSAELNDGELQPFVKMPVGEDKRTTWSNFRGSWGKRGNWHKLQGSWGKRVNREEPTDDLAAFQTHDYPSIAAGSNTDGLVYVIDEAPFKKSSWTRFGGSWGKRDDNKQVISPRSNNWSSLRGSWGKRSGNWNNFRGTWGKKSLTNLEDTLKPQ